MFMAGWMMGHLIKGGVAQVENGFEGHPGTAKLAVVISQRIKRETPNSLILDFGTIQENGSLITDTFPLPIPKGDYSVCRSVNGDILGTSESSWTNHLQEDKHIHSNPSTVPEHSHDVPMPKLKTGDRVLVAWVQNEAVVVDLIECS